MKNKKEQNEDTFNSILETLNKERCKSTNLQVLLDAEIGKIKKNSSTDDFEKSVNEGKELGKWLYSPDMQRIKHRGQYPNVAKLDRHQCNSSERTPAILFSHASGSTIVVSVNEFKKHGILGMIDGEGKYTDLKGFQNNEKIQFYKKVGDKIISFIDLHKEFSKYNDRRKFDSSKIDEFLRAQIEKNDPDTFFFRKEQLHDLAETGTSDGARHLKEFLSQFDVITKFGGNIVMLTHIDYPMNEMLSVADYVMRTETTPQSPANKVRPLFYSFDEIDKSTQTQIIGELINLSDQIKENPKSFPKVLKRLRDQVDYNEQEFADWFKIYAPIYIANATGCEFKPHWMNYIIKPNDMSRDNLVSLFREWNEAREEILNTKGRTACNELHESVNKKVSILFFKSNILKKTRPYASQYKVIRDKYGDSKTTFPNGKKNFGPLSSMQTSEDLGVSLEMITTGINSSDNNVLQFANKLVDDVHQKGFVTSLKNGDVAKLIKDHPKFVKLNEILKNHPSLKNDIIKAGCVHGTSASDGCDIGNERMGEMYRIWLESNITSIKDIVGDGNYTKEKQTQYGKYTQTGSGSVLLPSVDSDSITEFSSTQYSKDRDVAHTYSKQSGQPRNDIEKNPRWHEPATTNQRLHKNNIHDGLKYLFDEKQKCDRILEKDRSQKKDVKSALINLEHDFDSFFGQLELPFEDFDDFTENYTLNEDVKKHYFSEKGATHIMTIVSPEEMGASDYEEQVKMTWVKHS
jgi:hypothetical protein